MHNVLGIGFVDSEYEMVQQKWHKYDVSLEFAKSISEIHSLLDTLKFEWVLFHSRVLDCLPYINILRDIKTIPILVLTPEYTNTSQAQLAIEYLLKEKGQKIYANQALTAYTYGDLYFCQDKRIVRVRGQDIDLTAKEFDILTLLVQNPKRVFTYEMIIELVWKENYMFYSRKTVSNHVSSLRKKLRVSSDVPDFIKSIHGVGYKFDM